MHCRRMRTYARTGGARSRGGGGGKGGHFEFDAAREPRVADPMRHEPAARASQRARKH